MNLEVLPQIGFLIKVIIAIIGFLALLVVLVSAVEHVTSKHDEAKRTKMKAQMTQGLIAISVILVLFGVVSTIGPIFSFLFTGRF